ncbi:hypothetical protein D3C78_1347720 [compost metagenome]
MAISGATIPPAVIAATVAEPSAKRSAAAIDHASRIGETLLPSIRAAIYFSTPLSTSTCLNAPPPPMINSIMAIILMESVMVPITSSMVRPRFRPKVKIAISTAISVAITGSPKNSAKRNRL